MYGKQMPPVQYGDRWHRNFADCTTVEYDRGSHKLTADVKGDADVSATGSVTMKADGTCLWKLQLPMYGPLW